MAELPEVEILVQGLRTHVLGATIAAVEVFQPMTLRFDAPEHFSAALEGRQIQAARRRAKHILCELSDQHLLEMHCMLGGTLRLFPQPTAPDLATLIVYRLTDDRELHFRDRKGYARAAAGFAPPLIDRLRLATLGPEWLDASLDPAALAPRFAKRRGMLKSALTDQRFIAGLGNRDADESLWHARIDPRRPPISLSLDEIIRLRRAVLEVLEEGLRLGGTMTDLLGVAGRARQRRNAYGRQGDACSRCGTPINMIRIGSQITHYCPTCQT